MNMIICGGDVHMPDEVYVTDEKRSGGSQASSVISALHVRPISLLIAFVILLQEAFFLLPVFASGATPSDTVKLASEKSIVISTADNRPLSIDRLLYTAFKEIGWEADFVPEQLAQGYALTNDGQRSGVISSTPNMTEQYPNLVKVPVVIENNIVTAYGLDGNNISINGWQDLSGLRVGILTQRVYIKNSIPESAAAVVERNSEKLLLEGLGHDEYDVAVMSVRAHESVFLPAGISRIAHIELMPEFLYLHKTAEALAPEITESLKRLLSDGRGENILNNIYVPGLYQKDTIVHIVSSNQEVASENTFSEALKNRLSNYELVEWYDVSLDSRRFSGEANRLSYIASLLRKDCVSRNISAIIVSGDDTLNFLKDYYLLFFRNTPVIFYGVKDKDSINGFEQYFTGIFEDVSAADTVNQALELFPETKNIYVLNDYTPEGTKFRKTTEDSLKLNRSYTIDYNGDIPIEEVLREVRALPENSIVLVGSYFRDGDGQYYSQSETQKQLSEAAAVSNIPVFTLFSADIPYGALGGRCPDYEIYGNKVADILERIIGGENVANMQSESGAYTYNRWVFDHLELARFGIDENRLPEGSAIINKPPSIWETNPALAFSIVALGIFGVIVIAGLLLFLLNYRRQNRELMEARKHLHTAEELLEKDVKLKEVKERLETIINTAPVLYMLLVHDRCVEMNEHMRNSNILDIGDVTVTLYENPEVHKNISTRLYREKVIINEVIRLRTKRDGYRRFLVNIVTVSYEEKLAVAVWGVDIERDELKKDQLAIARQSLQTMLDTMPIAILIVDTESLDLVYCNNDCAKMLEFNSPGEAFRLSLYDVLSGSQSAGMNSVELADHIMGVSQAVVMEIQIKTGKGKTKDVRLRLSSIDYNGRSCKISILTDLSREKELRSVQRSLQTMLDSMPMPVRISDIKSRTILYANNACAELLGYDSAERMYGMRMLDSMPKIQSDGTPSIWIVKSVHASAGPVNGECEHISADGRIIETQVLNCPIDYIGREASMSIIRDLAVEREYQRMQVYLQTVLDFLPIPVRIWDISLKQTVYANKSALELFEISSIDEMRSGAIEQFLVQNRGSQEDQRATGSVLSATTTYEMICCKKSGEIFDARISECIIDYKGSPASLGILQDLTAEKEYQQMLLNTAEKEKEANQMKSRFLVNMSHEIRTPMNAVIGLTEIELRKKPPKETREVYKKINTSAKELLQIINDILDLSKIESDKMELFSDEFELEEVLNSAMLVATPRLDGKNVEMIMKASLDLPRFIVGDRTRLWQVLKNFLDNAAKYTETGKIVMTVAVVPEKTDEHTITLCFGVEDTGIGMNAQQLEAVFQPYEQFYSDAQKRYSGTGLGMPISKQMCELMGGQMSISSVPGKGTKITATIPFERAENKDTQLQFIKTPQLKGLNMLVVDNDDVSLDIMSGLLKCNDVNFVLARSGREAMQTIFEYRDMNIFFDIILLDYMMDGLSGLETARQIQMGLSKAPKLLMVTAYQKQLLRRELEASGIDEVIEKPFIPSEFIQKLCEAAGIDKRDEKDVNDDGYVVFSKANVLIVEDNRLNQEVASGMCKYFGISPVFADNGQHAIEKLNEAGLYDMIFMDLKMPVMDGYEATRVIRADGRWNDIPIVSLTADAMVEVVDKCMEAGMNDHLTKPIEIDKLHKALVKWLPESKRRTGGQKIKIKKKTHPKDEKERARSEALIRFQGDEKLYAKALLEFAGGLPDEWEDFDKIVENKEESLKYIHNLKGVAGNLSEMDIYNNAVHFESSLRKKNPSKELYGQLIEASNNAKKRIIEEFGEKKPVQKEYGSVTEFTDILSILTDALLNYDPMICSDVAERLRSKIWTFADEIQIKRMLEYTEAYEFDEAFEVLETLKDVKL